MFANQEFHVCLHCAKKNFFDFECKFLLFFTFFLFFQIKSSRAKIFCRIFSPKFCLFFTKDNDYDKNEI